jgi:hypothetical protein
VLINETDSLNRLLDDDDDGFMMHHFTDNLPVELNNTTTGLPTGYSYTPADVSTSQATSSESPILKSDVAVKVV